MRIWRNRIRGKYVGLPYGIDLDRDAQELAPKACPVDDWICRSSKVIDEPGVVLAVIAVALVSGGEIKVAVRTEMDGTSVVIGEAIEDCEQRFVLRNCY
jgi:hypothetical protein